LISVLIWWLIAQVLGWITLPVAMRFFRWLPDRGYAFAKPLGLLLVSYIVWLGASTGFLRNDLGGILFAILLVTAGSAWLLLRRSSGEPLAAELSRFLREHWRLVLAVELLFLVALAAWAGLRAYAPYKIEPAGGEKFMEIAFLNATLNSPQFPPLDPWLSGFGISYYYFGYVMMAVVTRLSAVAPGVGFDLYDALLFAFTLLGAFGVVYNLVKAAVGARTSAKAKAEVKDAASDGQPIAVGLLGALLVGVIGNLGGLLESLHAKGVLAERFWQWIDIPGLTSAQVVNSWYPGQVFMWWWRASRILHDKDLLGQAVRTQPIDEFPFFSFLLGDNHPHVLALPFVLLCIGLALNLLLRQRTPSPEGEGRGEVPRWWNPAGFSLGGDWALFFFSALLIGSLGFLNTWDMPIYLGLVALAYGLGEAQQLRRVERGLVLRTLVLTVGLGIASILLYIFFYISFGSQARGILPYLLPPTRLPQYLVMFGPFIFLLVCFLGVIVARQRGLRQVLRWWLRILLICAAFYLLLLLLAAVVALVVQDPTGVNPNPTLQSLFSGLELGQGIQASLQARLRDPWLLLLLTGLLAMALAAVQNIIFPQPSPQPLSQGERGEAAPFPSAESQGEVAPFPSAGSQAGVAPFPSGEGRGEVHASELFTFLLIFLGLTLTLLVEFIYLHDSFSARMNTVFKFYYQGWVMLACASAFALWWLLDRLQKPAGRTLVLAGAVIVIAAGMIYPLMAIPSRAGGFSRQPDLDGASGVAQSNPDDWAAIEWLRQNARSTDGSAPVIMEAPGASYTYEGRISAFTGYPAVLGWAIHESQWRGNYDEQGKREPDIALIYTTNDGQLMLDLLRKWQVDYLVLGEPEQTYIQRMCAQPGQGCSMGSALRKFDLLLTPVFSQGEITIYAVP
jgi:YYY domain-containing protein